MTEPSNWERFRPLQAAGLAKARNGREYPFAVGDQVHALEDWGPAVDDLLTYAKQHPGAIFTVHEVTAGGWISLEDETGRIYGGQDESRYGSSYFRIAGNCGAHFPAYRILNWANHEGAYACLRCGKKLPELTKLLEDASHA